jgi:nicotinamidase-related amidase
MSQRNYHLLVVDPQNDFCDLPAGYLGSDPVAGSSMQPALPVPGAHADMLRLAELIIKAAAGISGISVTLDSHHRLDIAHPTFWIDGEGRPVTPFTPITAAKVRSGRYAPRDSASLPRTLRYLDSLESAGRYTLMVWPVHCEIGTWGHSVHADVRAAYLEWESVSGKTVNTVIKGTNPWTEHYSAIQAEVPDEEDDTTQLNRQLIALLASADRVYIAGEAGSHCVKATTEHIVANLPEQNAGRLVLLTDCISPVAGFEVQYHNFLQDMRQRGIRLATSAEVLAELQANA